MGMNKHWEAFEAGMTKKKPLKWLWQRVTRGYDDRDIYDLDDSLIRLIYPRLKHFVTWQTEHGMSCAQDLDPAAWLEVLRKMERAFDILHERSINPEKDPPDPEDKVCWDKWVLTIQNEDNEIKEGLTLFGKYLQELFG